MMAIKCERGYSCYVNDRFLLGFKFEIDYLPRNSLMKSVVKEHIHFQAPSFCQYFNQCQHSLAILTAALYCYWLNDV